MKNKILVFVYVPTIEKKYEVFIPVGKKVYTVIKCLAKAISELSGGLLENKENFQLYNKNTGLLYAIDVIIKETDMKNGSELILI